MPPPIVHSPAYDAQFPADHRFPMEKYSRLAAILKRDGLVPDGFVHPEPAEAPLLAHAHDPGYVDQVLAVAVPERIERLIGFPVSPLVAMRARAAASGTVLAARLAMAHGLALNSAGGSHHARYAHGAGFCTFNDVAVAAAGLLADHVIGRVLVVDLDVHQGDGTADIFRDEQRVVTVSVHAAKNYPHDKVASNVDIALPDGVEDEAYLAIVEEMLENVWQAGRPDLVFYNAGVDPHRDDRLGRLALSDRGLEERDRTVIDFFRTRDIPLCGVIGGGYGKDVDAIAERHAILFRVASEFA
jgi:acetoin utilization deacetylase AcuC-like enzyme